MPKQLQQGEKAKIKSEKAWINNHLHHKTKIQLSLVQLPLNLVLLIQSATAPQTSATEASGSSQADISPPPRTQHEILKDFSDEWIISLDRCKKSLAMFLLPQFSCPLSPQRYRSS